MVPVLLYISENDVYIKYFWELCNIILFISFTKGNIGVKEKTIIYRQKGKKSKHKILIIYKHFEGIPKLKRVCLFYVKRKFAFLFHSGHSPPSNLN